MHNIIVIGDTHFGVKNNSLTWLKHQIQGFDEIVNYIEYSIRSFDRTTIIHVGDLFDSRSSINPIIYKEVSRELKRIDEILDGNGMMYIIGGNHDYYYPNETSKNFTGIQMLPKFNSIQYIVKESTKINIQGEQNAILIPWFEFHNFDTLKHILKNTSKNDIIFTHTDPIHWEANTRKFMEGMRLVTGHIHQPSTNRNVVITGASFPIDFADANSDRGFWNILDGNIEKICFHPIESSIHFFVLHEDDLTNWREKDIREDDYVEVLIKSSKIQDYENEIKELNGLFNVNISYIPENISIMENTNEPINVDTVFRKLLPEKLKILYQQMIEDCKKNL